MANDAGSVALTGKRDFDKAKKLIAEAGYKGEKIIVLDAVDQPNPHAQALVTADLLKKLGLNVELAAMDWGSVVTRRASKEPPEKGGWNIFGTGWVGADMLDPALNVALRANGEKAWFGWPSDDKIEALRAQWIAAETLDERQETRRRDPAARLRGRTLYSDRPMDADDRVPQKRQGRRTRPGLFHVECRKNLTPPARAISLYLQNATIRRNWRAHAKSRYAASVSVPGSVLTRTQRSLFMPQQSLPSDELSLRP